MKTRMEILRDGVWYPLKLRDGEIIKYNVLINKIGKLNTRELSHTNTFRIDRVHKNISALDLNTFNPSKLATALNKKYEAKYYVGDVMIQKGYIVVNNIIVVNNFDRSNSC